MTNMLTVDLDDPRLSDLQRMARCLGLVVVIDFKEHTVELTEAQQRLGADIKQRFTNHPPIDDEVVSRLEAVTGTMIDVASTLCALVPEGRERSLMLTQLEQASMWAKAGIARNQLDPTDAGTHER